MKRKCIRWMALGFLMSIVLSITGTFAAIGEKETIKMLYVYLLRNRYRYGILVI